jgi:signal transduction histidine kinase/HAMP domain-containing protein
MTSAMPMRIKTSISSLIFVAFIAMGLLTGAVGGYSLVVLSAARNFVTDTYDRTLMAVSYARAASADFSRMDKELLRRRFAPPADQATIDQELDQLSTTFAEDLDVVEKLSKAADERMAAEEVRILAAQWTALRHSPAGVGDIEAIARKLDERLDILMERAADNSFVSRREATTRMARFTYTTSAATVVALLLSAGVTLLLARRIIRPLAAAAAVANRIAAGELDTPIPPGGQDETGTLLRSMIVMQDSIRVMVEREKAQRRSAQNRLVEALETSHEAIALIDGAGRIVIANTQLSRFFPTLAPQLAPEMSFAEAFGRVRELVGEDRDEAARDHVAGDLLSAGSQFRLADGRWLRVSRSPTEEGGFFLVISDFSDVKEKEEHLNEARLQAEAASEAKSSFLANMSHELRTPLNAIIGFSEILSGQVFGELGNPKYLEYANDIEQSGAHLLTVINNVLDLTKSQAGMLELTGEAVDLGGVTESCAKMMRGQCARAKLSLAVAVPSTPLLIWGDSAKLRQILLNLMSNAVKFTEPGGSVTVCTEVSGDSWAVLRVIDTGIGMSPADISIALVPFGQVDSRLARRYDGTGLGLPLTKALVELHGGSIAIHSACGEGTEIIVTLPQRAAAASAARVAEAIV